MIHGSCLLWHIAIAGLSLPISVVIVPRLGKDVKARHFAELVA